MELTGIVILTIVFVVCVVVGVIALLAMKREETVASRHFSDPDGMPEGCHDDPNNLSALDVDPMAKYVSLNDTLEGRRRAMRATERSPLHRQPWTGRKGDDRGNRYADEDETGAITPGFDPDYPDVSGGGVPYGASYFPGSERDTADADTARQREDRWYPPIVDPSTWAQPGIQPGEPRTGVPDLDRQYGAVPGPESPAGAHTHGHAGTTHHAQPDPSPTYSAPEPTHHMHHTPAPDPTPSPSYDPGPSSPPDSGSSGGWSW